MARLNDMVGFCVREMCPPPRTKFSVTTVTVTVIASAIASSKAVSPITFHKWLANDKSETILNIHICTFVHGVYTQCRHSISVSKRMFEQRKCESKQKRVARSVAKQHDTPFSTFVYTSKLNSTNKSPF